MIESEIQFLISLVLNHKISAEVKKLCLERIGQIEQTLRSPQPMRATVTSAWAPATAVQAPSTQAILDSMQPIPQAAVPVHIPPQARDKETGLVNVVTSQSPTGSTRGPSKVFR